MANYGPHGIPSRIPSSAATNNATVAKAARGGLHAVTGYNTTAAVKYLKFYDKATTPAPGTDNALLMLSIALPPSTGFALNYAGLKFLNGISYALVTGSSDTDNTSVASGDIVGLNVSWE